MLGLYIHSLRARNSIVEEGKKVIDLANYADRLQTECNKFNFIPLSRLGSHIAYRLSRAPCFWKVTFVKCFKIQFERKIPPYYDHKKIVRSIQSYEIIFPWKSKGVSFRESTICHIWFLETPKKKNNLNNIVSYNKLLE